MRKLSFALAGVLLAVTSASAVGAQVFTPTYQSTQRSSDIGLYLADLDTDVGDDLAIEGILRRSAGGYDLGLRLGVVEDAILVGFDTRAPLSVAGTAPLALALTFGGQGALGDANAFGAQVGLTVGHTFTSPGVSLTPYIHPRAAVLFGDVVDEGFDPRADLGIDVALNPNFVIRFGANLADGADFGIGLALRR